jgi:hypothetical protein
MSFRLGKKSKITGDSDLSLDFKDGTTRDCQEVAQFAIRKAALAFGNVARH